MEINGRKIAQDILDKLKKQIADLRTQGIVPKLVVILIGDNPDSLTYIKQKQLKAEEIGAVVDLLRFDDKTPQQEIVETVERLNSDTAVHGIIVQRPMPSGLGEEKIYESVRHEKDIDGFVPHSDFDVPVAMAVIEILRFIHAKSDTQFNFTQWLESRIIAVLGRGNTAGKPIIEHFEKLRIKHQVIHSQTQNPQDMVGSSDIVISAVGKKVINRSMLKPGVILIGVGIRGEDGKLRGDYAEEEIKEVASFYTPTPGGVGPVNVASLLKNLVTAAQKA